MVDPSVGTDESEAVFDDDGARSCPKDATAFRQDQFAEPRVFPRLPGQPPRRLPRMDVGQIAQSAFGFRHDLLADDDDITILQRNPRRAERGRDPNSEAVSP